MLKMLITNKNRYFEIIRENVFSDDGSLLYDNYVEEFQPYDVNRSHKKYANFGAIQILEFGMKSESEYNNSRKDKKFQKKYERTKEYISTELFNSYPILETHVDDALSHNLLTPFLRNLTYGKSTLSVWIEEEQTYVLVNAGRGESACNLLFFCRVENSTNE